MCDPTGEVTPWIFTPFTQVSRSWYTFQYSKCADAELDFFRCSYRVGKRRAPQDCYRELADFRECVNHHKEMKRTLIMRKERQVQGKPYETIPANYLNPTFSNFFDLFKLWPKRKKTEESKE